MRKILLMSAMFFLFVAGVIAESDRFDVVLRISNFTASSFVIRFRDESSGKEFHLCEIGKMEEVPVDCNGKFLKGRQYSVFVSGHEDLYSFSGIWIPMNWNSDKFVIDWHISDKKNASPSLDKITFSKRMNGSCRTEKQRFSENQAIEDADISSPIVISFNSHLNNDISVAGVNVFESEENGGRNMHAKVIPNERNGKSEFSLDMSENRLQPNSEYSIVLDGLMTVEGVALSRIDIPVRTAGDYSLESVKASDVNMEIRDGKLSVTWRSPAVSYEDTLLVFTKRGWEIPVRWGYHSENRGVYVFDDINWRDGFYILKIASQDESGNSVESEPFIYIDEDWGLNKKVDCENLVFTFDSAVVRNALRSGVKFFVETSDKSVRKEILEEDDYRVSFDTVSKIPGTSEKYRAFLELPENFSMLDFYASEKTSKVEYPDDNEYKTWFLKKSEGLLADAEKKVEAVRVPKYSGSVENAYSDFNDAMSEMERVSKFEFPPVEKSAAYKKEISGNYQLRLAYEKKRQEITSDFLSYLAHSITSKNSVNSKRILDSIKADKDYEQFCKNDKSIQKNATAIEKKYSEFTNANPRVTDIFSVGYVHLSNGNDAFSSNGFLVQAFSKNFDHIFVNLLNFEAAVSEAAYFYAGTVDIGVSAHLASLFFPFAKMGIGYYYTDNDDENTDYYGVIAKIGYGTDIKITNHIKIVAEYNFYFLFGCDKPAMDAVKLSLTFGKPQKGVSK